jgi:hypothetical protein
MKQLCKIPILIIVTLMGCDRSIPLEINANKVYSIETDCGKINFKVSTLSNFITIYQECQTGEFELNFDSLSISMYPENVAKIDKVKFYDKEKLITDNRKKVTSGDLIKIYLVFNKPIYTTKGTLFILPCNFIVCKGSPLIVDTLKIIF